MNKYQEHRLYLIDVLPLLKMQDTTHADDGNTTSQHPASVAQHALAYWNTYLTHGEHEYSDAFLRQANWLLDHELSLPNGIGGWPVPLAERDYYATGPFLAASVQGMGLSVLTRAYQLTGKEAFLHAARRALYAFEFDILDGGINTPLGDKAIFFEEVAVYPAAHILHGHLLGMLGLYDYAMLIKNNEVEELILHSLTALHTLIDAFDTGYWTRYDLLHRHFSSLSQHTLHIKLLEAIAQISGSVRFSDLAIRWKSYQQQPKSRLHHWLVTHVRPNTHSWLGSLARRPFVHSLSTNQHTLLHVCVPVTAFPVPGGTRGVLEGVALAMSKRWQMTYVTAKKGADTAGLDIRRFGLVGSHPWHFPGVWLYFITGLQKLFVLLCHRPGYSLIIPQDGVSTGAFAALIGRLTGVRVVCMDHGSITLLDNPAFRIEQADATKKYRWHQRIRSVIHWPSMHVLARIAVRYSDLFFVAGDEVENAYRKNFGVHPDRIMRYTYMIGTDRFTPPTTSAQAKIRTAQNIPTDAIVITLINRLAPEKGLDVAMDGIALTLEILNQKIHERVRIVIAGEGPLRSQIEADIQRYNLNSTCLLWGSATPKDVVLLLGITDIFLYAGTRGTNYSIAVLEAMAACCAVVASVVPQSNAKLLADGRGIAIAPSNPMEIRDALVRLCNDPALCRQMGELSREYVATNHNALMLERSLLRASFFQLPIVMHDRQLDNLAEKDRMKELY